MNVAGEQERLRHVRKLHFENVATVRGPERESIDLFMQEGAQF